MVATTGSPAAALHGPWFGRTSWCILDLAGDGSAGRFLTVWQAWRATADRPRLLHHVLVASDAQLLLRCAEGSESNHPELGKLLAAAAYGLTRGVQRLSFEAGHVTLTLALGSMPNLLRQLQLQADRLLWSVGTGNSSLQPSNIDHVKSLARLCRRGAALGLDLGPQSSSRSPLSNEQMAPLFRQCGFVPTDSVRGPGEWELDAVFAPSWRDKTGPSLAAPLPRTPATQRCVVVGAGLAGAAVAASLARRGCLVQVLDAGAAPASGASGLPVGLLTPHFSADDNGFSRLTRVGARMTWQVVARLLPHGLDWNLTGVLEIRPAEKMRKVAEPADDAWPGMRDWDRPASDEQLRLAGLAATSAARWHQQAGWIRAEALVRALLDSAGVTFRGRSPVAAVNRGTNGWELLRADGAVLATADLVVVAAGVSSDALLSGILHLQALHGQVSWGMQTGSTEGLPDTQRQGTPAALHCALPPFPVHGKGSLISGIALPSGTAWYIGASYRRGQFEATGSADEHRENLARLATILPASAAALRGQFDAGEVTAWCGTRATTPDRLPIAGRIETGPHAGLWVCTGMGSRGLSFALLCGELLAAQMNDEPWPLERSIGLALSPERFNRAQT